MNPINLLILAIVTERITEIIVDSEIAGRLIRKPIKNWVYPNDHPPNSDFVQDVKVSLDYLINCGYCTSVWVGQVVSLCTYNEDFRLSQFTLFDIIFKGILLHGLSNFYHIIYQLIKRGRVMSIDVQIKKQEE